MTFDDKIEHWIAEFCKSNLPSVSRYLLHCLALHFHLRQGRCYQSIEELAAGCGLSKRTVIKHLRIVEDAGWIKVTFHGFTDQRWRRHSYALAFPETGNGRGAA
ncbi:ArsR/SmtB family transcription factor [Pseudovibrio exalbescens]|uniref:ArsR/SmtB family transcription factor n=1 Tax=Pseudovibrio exalbescens TaxID=197461 RepID=UPI000C9B288D|nr:helix-turn-helix domain-containing protein [Pseudovibrio exalbescens]